MALEPLRLLRDAQERLQPPVRRPMPPREAEAPYQPFEPLPKNATPSDVRAAAVRWWTLDGARWAERWPDFPPRELACRANADNVKADAGLVYMHPRVLDALQAMRDDLRVPLVVTSAYRAPRYNAWVGGAKDSQHMYGLAVDIRCDTARPEDIIAAATRNGAVGVGTYPRQNFVHLDWRGGGPARWGEPFAPRPAAMPHGEDGNAEVKAERDKKAGAAAREAAGGGVVVAGGAAAAEAARQAAEAGDPWLDPELMITIVQAGLGFAASVLTIWLVWRQRHRVAAWLRSRS